MSCTTQRLTGARPFAAARTCAASSRRARAARRCVRSELELLREHLAGQALRRCRPGPDRERRRCRFSFSTRVLGRRRAAFCRSRSFLLNLSHTSAAAACELGRHRLVGLAAPRFTSSTSPQWSMGRRSRVLLVLGDLRPPGPSALLARSGSGTGTAAPRRIFVIFQLVHLLVEDHGRRSCRGSGCPCAFTRVEVLVDTRLLAMPPQADGQSARHGSQGRAHGSSSPSSLRRAMPSSFRAARLGRSRRGGLRPRSRSARRATDTRWSPSSSWMRRTPWVLRPMVEMSRRVRGG